ncbi:hypothetical protein [Streptomyces wedmorensis]
MSGDEQVALRKLGQQVDSYDTAVPSHRAGLRTDPLVIDVDGGGGRAGDPSVGVGADIDITVDKLHTVLAAAVPPGSPATRNAGQADMLVADGRRPG